MNFARLSLTLIVATLAGMSVATGAAAVSAQETPFDQDPLRWKFAVGDEHRFQLVQQMHMTMDLGEAGEIESTVDQTVDMTWHVESIDDAGTATFSIKITRVKIHVEAPGQIDVAYDTASEADPIGFSAMLSPVVKAFRETTIQMTMTRRGQLSSIEIPEKLIAKMRAMPSGTMLGDLATPLGFQNMLQNIAMILPEGIDLTSASETENVTEAEIPHVGTILTTTTYRYEGSQEADGERLETFRPTLQTTFGGLGDVEIEVTNEKTDGKIVFNRIAGRLESSTLRHECDMAVTIGGKLIEQRLEQTVELRRE